MTRREFLSGSVGLALQRQKLDQAVRLIEGAVAMGEVPAAVLDVRGPGLLLSRAFGAARTPQAVFLLASITKPMTATAVMILSDRGELSLDDPVRKFIPEFRGGGRDRVILRHLLTHTSGLPDMLPENEELRKRHAPLKDFVTATCRTPLLFTPGTKVSYQSMGVLLAGEVVERITRRLLRDFMRQEIFEPLEMRNASLGLGGRKIADTIQCQLDEHTDWDWNSLYWRDLGSPWGGALASAEDVSRLLACFANSGSPILKVATASAMITNQNQGLGQAYGLGWRLGSENYGKGASARTFGHGGSTGTLAWFDPVKRLSFVLLTTKPAAVSQKTLLSPVSNLVAAV